MMDSNIYFAAKPADECITSLLNKGDTFFNAMRSNAYLDKLVRMWRAYHGSYGGGDEGHMIQFTGEQGELVSLPVNHFRNLARITFNMVTATRPVMQARAANTDYKSLSQTYLANGILEYYMREKHLESYLKKAVELAIVLGSGFIKMDWNATAGEAYDIDNVDESGTGQKIYEGDVVFTILSQFDVVFDGTKEGWDNEWIMCRSYQNRFNLIAKYPELEEELRSIPNKSEKSIYRLALWSNDETDDIPVYEFYHKKTEAMPDGRYLFFATPECCFLDTKFPFPEIPVYRIVPSEILGTPYGYSDMFDVFPIQEMINATISAVATNNNAFAVQSIFVPRDSDITISSLEGGMNIIEGNSPPVPINLTQTPAETFKLLEVLVESAETISGINSVARGQPDASLKSGAALALVQSMALQYISGLQQSYVQLIENIGSSLIKFLQVFAKTPRVAAIVGQNNKSYLKEFSADDLDKISRVYVDMGNPLSQCLEKDTPVLMYDGSIKMVQDIKINDQVMGPDSKPRTVQNANSGTEMMYEVSSKDEHRKVKYGCNESHILSLKYCSDDYRYPSAKKGNIVDISVRDYLKLPDRHKRLLQGFKTRVEFSKKDLIIPPYILGSWLGDGTSAASAITTSDNEIREEWFNYAESIGMQFRTSTSESSGKAKTYFITSGEVHGKSDRNPMMNELHAMEVLNNKHIPNIYLTSNRQDRLQLLAGLIDTDGTRIDETFVFTQKSDVLTKNVVFLAESLGFRVTYRKRKCSPSKLVPNASGEINTVTIGGNTWEVPTRLPRKQTQAKGKARDWLNYGVKITSKGEGTYYGFTLKEEPHFVLGDFTVTHNTTAGRVQMAEQMLQMGAIKNPMQYLQVINTGRLDSAIENDEKQLLLIKAENERLMSGENPLVAPTDRHKIHIQEHDSVIADPDVRQNPQLVKVVMDHIQEHMNALRNTDPDLLSMIGEVALPPLPPLDPMTGMPMQGGPQGSMPPPEGPQGPGGGSNAPVLEPQQGLPKSGDIISGPGVDAGQMIPKVPNPPPPFQNSPVNPNQMPTS